MKLFEKSNSYLKTTAHPALIITLTTVGFLVFAVLVIQGSGSDKFAPLWYGNAIAVIGLLLLEKRFWPIAVVAFALATIAGNGGGGFDLLKSMAFIPGNMASILLSAVWISRQPDPFHFTVSLKAFARLFLVLLIPISVGQAISSLALALVAEQPFFSTLVGLFLSDLNGYIVVIPLGLALFADPVTVTERTAFWKTPIWSKTRISFYPFYGFIACAAVFMVLAVLFARWPLIWVALIGSALGAVLSFRALTAYIALTSLVIGIAANRGLILSLVGSENSSTFNELMISIFATVVLPLGLGVMRRSERIASHLSAEQIRETQKERAKFETLFNESPDAYFVIGAEDHIIADCNQAAGNMLGVRHTELIGESIAHYEPEYQPNGIRTKDLIASATEQVVATGASKVDMLRLRKDGSTFWVSGSVSRITYEERPANLWVWRDITERKRLVEQLFEARETAERASRAKGQFLSTMSHELRTPLSGIMGMFELIKRSDAGGRVHEFATRGLDSSEHLLQLITGVLDLASIEAGRLTIISAPLHMRSLFEEVVGLVEAKRRDGVELTLHLDGSLRNLELMGDAMRLKQVLINLLGNALKFTERGTVELSAVRVGGSADKPQIEFSVKDTGIGLTSEQRVQLFQPFSQVDESAGRKFGGTGLGLVISQHLVNLMGGEAITVESTFGNGSRFAFRLSMPTASQSDSTRVKGGLAASSEPNQRLAGYRVLLVEDDELSRLIIKLLLETEGASVDEATDGISGMNTALSAMKPFDAILMDNQLPLKNGVEATRELRARGYGHPIIAITAAAFKSDREAFELAGANDYITKPVNIEKLIESLKRIRSVVAGS